MIVEQQWACVSIDSSTESVLVEIRSWIRQLPTCRVTKSHDHLQLRAKDANVLSVR